MRYSCPACDAPLRLKDEPASGVRVRCPDCGKSVTPRRRLKQKESHGGDMIMYAGLGVLALALVVGGIVLAVLLSRDSRPNAVAQQPAPDQTPPVQPPVQPSAPDPQPTPPEPAVPAPNVVATRPPVVDTPPRRAPEPGPLPDVGFDIGNLAPDIEGEDTDGRPFKLSDYRGKVVVLDFWGHW